MNRFQLRPADLNRDLAFLAAQFSLEEDEPTAPAALQLDYETHKDRIFTITIAESEPGEPLGFNWGTSSRFDPGEAYFYVIVAPQHRFQGLGALLYQDLERAASELQIERLVVDIRDTCPECLAFANHRGFIEKTHRIGMILDLASFNDRVYDPKIESLRAQGFVFTNMEVLGDTFEARQKLYTLNNTTAMQTQGSDGKPSWLSFEDFQKSVCQSEWYIPAAQFVTIDSATGNWAAMSAITRFEGTDYAYNLFTGVDERYRGRGLAQATKTFALRFARDVLRVDTVRTHHNTHNPPIIAIDRKMGYRQSPGWITLQKELPRSAGGQKEALNPQI
ncbi:MAG: GNAT family N-acetyltransferase [Anaerolineaceae bacterium]